MKENRTRLRQKTLPRETLTGNRKEIDDQATIG